MWIIIGTILVSLIFWSAGRVRERTTSLKRVGSSISDSLLGPKMTVTNLGKKAKMITIGQRNLVLPIRRGASKFSKITARLGDQSYDLTPPPRFNLYFKSANEIGVDSIEIQYDDDQVKVYTGNDELI